MELHQIQNRSVARANDLDFKFLKQILNEKDFPELNGFNTKFCRKQGGSVMPATTALYTHLIDVKPSDPDTMMTVMMEAKRLTNTAGQDYVIFTTDQALYRIAVDIKWCYPEEFNSFVLRLEGMHTLMSFVGCVETLMTNTGLEDILKSVLKTS